MKADSVHLYELLRASALVYPQRKALEYKDEAIYYHQLSELSEQLADELAQLGLKQGFRAGVLMPKCIQSVAIIFAILKAGGAYIPLDIEAPAERNRYIADDCELSLLFLPGDSDFKTAESEDSAEKKKRIRVRKMDIDIVLFSDIKNRSDSPEGLAYILYTSGSTGKPKGVMFTHQNALSFINWCSTAFEIDEKSVLSSHAPFHFDLSIFDLFVSIKHAAALVLIDAKHGKNPRLLSQLIEEKKITHWYSTPTILKLMLHYGKIDRYDHTSLMYVLFAGEVFPVKPLKQLTEIWPHAKFFNLYGPTETNVCTWFKIPLPLPKSQLEPFPIGEVCSHLEGKLVHRGTAGNELCISGPAVCIGYWKDDAQTGKSTFYDEGKRWYSTGDLVSVNSNGDYVYRERIDRMVKKNGFRVELGEIENVLHRMPEITDAAAISTVDEDLQGKIKVFVQKKAEEDLNSVQLKQFCLNYLPHYMVPDEFIYLKKIPKTSTNKTDYQKLKAYSS